MVMIYCGHGQLTTQTNDKRKRAPCRELFNNRTHKLIPVVYSGRPLESRRAWLSITKTADEGDQEVVFTPDELRIPFIIYTKPELQPLDGLVYAVVFWMQRLKDGRCWASNKTIAKVLGVKHGSVANALTRLRDAGFIECLYDDNGSRKEIRTLVYYTVNPSSGNEGGVHQVMNIDKNIKEEYTSEMKAEVNKVYRAWLWYMVVDPMTLPLGPTTDDKHTAIEAAAKKFRLTDSRKHEIVVRLGDAGLANILKAIRALAKSDFHRGDNDRGWTADMHFLFRNYEQTEIWANKYKKENQ